VVSGAAVHLKRRVADFLRAEAMRRITVRVAPHAEALGVTPRAIRLKDTRSRWGSCAPNGILAFSWRLVMAPDWVMDYVVAHEVAHLRELNHSTRFWAHVDRLVPTATRRWSGCAWRAPRSCAWAEPASHRAPGTGVAMAFTEEGSRGLRRVVRGFLLVTAAFVALSLATGDWGWFAQSGAIVTALGLVLASRKILIARADLLSLPGEMEAVDGAERTARLESFKRLQRDLDRQTVEKAGFGLLVLGTLIWGFGDLVGRI
jgi:hypothetical protein